MGSFTITLKEGLGEWCIIMGIVNKTIDYYTEVSFLMPKKQFTKEQKLEILEYYKSHAFTETCEKYNVSRSSIFRWKQQIKNNEDISNKSGAHITSKGMKEVALFHLTKDLSKLSREDLELYARFWSDMGKYKMELLKKKKKK